MDDVITLVAETITRDSDGVSVPVETSRQVFASISSIARSEFYQAGEMGLLPSYTARTAAINYEGEGIAIFHDKRYGIYRTYERGDMVELYLQERVGMNEYTAGPVSENSGSGTGEIPGADAGTADGSDETDGEGNSNGA